MYQQAGRLLIPMSPSDQSKGGKCGFDLFDTPRNRKDCRHAERRDRRRIQFENMVSRTAVRPGHRGDDSIADRSPVEPMMMISEFILSIVSKDSLP